jgi:hypothetical protein
LERRHRGARWAAAQAALARIRLWIEARTTAAKPKNKQEVFEAAALRPLCELTNLFRLHRLGAGPTAESRLARTMACLKFL